MIESSSEFENIMIFKNQLINLDKKEIIKVYQDVSNYALFLNTIIMLINNENVLFLLDDNYLDKVYSILDIHRYDLNDSDVFDTVNDIIDALNIIKTIKSKEEYVREYVKYQESLRGFKFKEPDDFLYALSYDAVVIAGLRDNNIPIQYDDLFISSIRYFINIYPDYFDDYEILDNVYQKLEEINSRKGIKYISNRKDAKKLIKALNYLKEE